MLGLRDQARCVEAGSSCWRDGRLPRGSSSGTASFKWERRRASTGRTRAAERAR
ncbi:MAG: hypothetical protein MZW92_65675 [Comamonadaceae bacterium]|nr:hypothetical protein [Comamonadaceae bacterium]